MTQETSATIMKFKRVREGYYVSVDPTLEIEILRETIPPEYNHWGATRAKKNPRRGRIVWGVKIHGAVCSDVSGYSTLKETKEALTYKLLP